MRPVFILLIAIASLLLANNYNDQFIKVNPGGTLDIRLTSSNIIINTWNKNELQVSTSIKDALHITNESNTVTIRQGESGRNSDLHINIPAHFNIKIKTSAGNHIINGNMKGNIEIENAGGNITFNDVNGSVLIQTGGGNIFGHDISGSVSINSYGGDITLGAIRGNTSVVTGGGNIKINGSRIVELIESSGGNLIIKDAAGNGKISTGGGNIDIGNADGNLSIKSYGGNIRINRTGGRTDVETSGGDIRIREVNGALKAECLSGDVFINFTSRAKTSSVNSSNGDLRIGIAGDLNAEITATRRDINWWKDENNSEKTVKSDFELSSLKRDKGKQEVISVYKTGSGSNNVKIYLETNYGEIFIKKSI
jgi:hypothetical protein